MFDVHFKHPLVSKACKVDDLPEGVFGRDCPYGALQRDVEPVPLYRVILQGSVHAALDLTVNAHGQAAELPKPDVEMGVYGKALEPA